MTKEYVAAMLAVVLIATALISYIVFQTGMPGMEPTLTIAPTQTLSPLPTPSESPTPLQTQTAQPTQTPSETPNSTNKTVGATNWAGFLVATDLQTPQPNVTGVSASWTVPWVAGSANDTYSAVWIGIGGQFDSSLIQCGTAQRSIGGQVSYTAWYELLPQQARIAGAIRVSPGDKMQASIQLVDAAKKEWSIIISDLTTHKTFQASFVYNSSQLSAEWILERPTVNHVLTDLADFDNVTFTDCKADFGSISGGITSFPYVKNVMYASNNSTRGIQLVDVAEPSANGSSFTISYLKPS